MKVTENEIRTQFTHMVGAYIMKGFVIKELHSNEYNPLSCYIRMANAEGKEMYIGIVAPDTYSIGEIKLYAKSAKDYEELHWFYKVKCRQSRYIQGKESPAIIFDEDEYYDIKRKRETRKKIKDEIAAMRSVELYGEKLEIAKRFLKRKLDEYNYREKHRSHWYSEAKYYHFEEVKELSLFRQTWGNSQRYEVVYKFKRCKKVDDAMMNASSFWAHSC